MRKYSIFLVLILICCKVKKDINKFSEKTETTSQVRTEIEAVEVGNKKRVIRVDKIELTSGNTLIFPRGKFTFEEGRFEGEADSVVIKSKSIRTDQSKETDTSQNHFNTSTRTDKKTSIAEKKEIMIKQIEKTPNFLGWTGGLFLFLFLVFIIWKIRTWKP